MPLVEWLFPADTDIAFALGILTLLGKSVPVSLKIFLTSLAIFDERLSIILGSLASGVLGFIILKISLSKNKITD